MTENPAWIAPDTLSIRPIGFIRTSQWSKFESPHQPKNAREERNVIELNPKSGFEVALRDLEGFDRIWLVWWFHRNTSWKPLVLPPRGEAKKRGVFATRSPHRPNPLGITSVPLLAIEKRALYVGNTDLLDGTPILDIKPYIATIDSFPTASLGWLSEVEAELAKPPQYSVEIAPKVKEQLEWLMEQHSIDFMSRVTEILSRNPTVHRTRRIRKFDGNRLQIKCGAWRAVFAVEGNVVKIESISAGYPDRLLQQELTDWIPDHCAQRAFREQWEE